MCCSWWQIVTVDEAEVFYPLFGLGANVALIISGQTVTYFSKVLTPLKPKIRLSPNLVVRSKIFSIPEQQAQPTTCLCDIPAIQIRPFNWSAIQKLDTRIYRPLFNRLNLRDDTVQIYLLGLVSFID